VASIGRNDESTELRLHAADGSGDVVVIEHATGPVLSRDGRWMAYRQESSPIHEIDELETPVLLMHGDDDGVVDFRQGLQYYNYARRAGKPVVMLVYPGAGHGLSQESHQIDYHRRILEWFGHWLKGEEPAPWIVEGEDFQARELRMEGGG